jgi:hypothetical protein
VDCDRVWRKQAYVRSETHARVLSNDHRFWLYLERLLPKARELFNDDSILPTYACWSMYYEVGANLPKHKDKNACTFTLDYCVRQLHPWDLFVEGTPYTLQENQALAFMGEDQEHWRPSFSPGNIVEMIFFHFARPDHWYFTE